MTLAELANLICTEVNQTETEDVAACKLFLQRGFAIIWQAALWKDSLFEYTQTLGAVADYTVSDTWLPTKNTLLLPVDISHVIAARTGTNKLNVESSEIFYRSDWDKFADAGTPRDYRLLPPCVWEFDTAQTLFRRALNVADVPLAVVVDVFRSASNAKERVTATALGLVDRVDSFSKAVTTAAVAIGGALTVYNLPGGGQIGVGVDAAADDDFTAVADGGSLAVDANCGNTIDIAQQIPASGGQTFGEVVGQADGTVTSPFGVLTYNNNSAGRTFVAGAQILTLAAAETAMEKRQRIQLFGSVTSGTVIRVLGKIKPPTFSADADEPALTGCEDALLAFAQARMLRRERQYAKAGGMMQEAGALLEQLKKEQTVQQAYHKRLIPETGYGDDYGLNHGLQTESKNW